MKKVNQKRKITALLWGLLPVFLLIYPGSTQAQTNERKIISGKVVSNADGNPMMGVSLLIKGSSVGTQTNAKGEFTISAKEKDILVISSLGYTPQELMVGKKNQVNARLIESNASTLSDVVVIGYGTARRPDLTGSISSITGEELRKSQPTTIDQALQGKIAGVVVQQVSGQPGGGVSVQINGLSSFTNNPPMYVIDGVIVGVAAIDGSGTNPLSSINPSEVESVDVLKDASATAIYGSQATNGVVIITTKRGKTGPPNITYDGYAGNQSLPKYYPTMNLREYAQYINDRNVLFGGFDNRPQFANPQYLGEGTNWQKELFRKAPMQNHSISVSGGDSRTKYFFSGGYFSQEGIALGSNFKRISVRINLDNKTTDWLKIGTSLQLANVNERVNSTNSNIIKTALEQTPDVNAQNPDGGYPGNDQTSFGVYSANPFALAQIKKDDKKRYQIFGNAYAEITFTKNLSLRNEVSGDFDFGTQDQFTPTYRFGAQTPNTVNSSTYNSARSYTTTIRNFLTYTNYYKKYYFNVLLGHEAQERGFSNVTATRTGFPSNNVQAINAGDPATASNKGDQGSSAQESYFGRLNLTYNDKYLLTVNVRDDGSSKFAPANQWVVTYSGAFAWKMANETFIKQLNFFNELKWRVGYGLTNNQNIADNSYYATLATAATGLGGVALQTKNLPNPDTKWETTKTFNLGVDASILKNRIQVSIDYYDKKTDGLLLSIPLPAYSGTASSGVYSPGSLEAPYKNIGSVSNKGFNMSITTVNIKSKTAAGFNWTSSFTLSNNKNKILSLTSDNDALTKGVSRSVVGRSLGEFFGYQTDGIFSSAQDFKDHPAIPANSTTGLPSTIAEDKVWIGDVMFRDLNGDGLITEKDKTFLGSPRPTYQLGMNNSFAYRNFDFTVFFSASTGNKVYNQLRVNGEDPGANFGYFKNVLNYSKIAKIDPAGPSDINNLHVTNPESNIIRITKSRENDNTRFSDRYVEDGSFIRCKTVALGYTFPRKLLERAHLGSLRIYANVSNLFIISNYSGYDPEVSSYDPLQAGIDFGYYPQPRVFTFGASLSLKK